MLSEIRSLTDKRLKQLQMSQFLSVYDSAAMNKRTIAALKGHFTRNKAGGIAGDRSLTFT